MVHPPANRPAIRATEWVIVALALVAIVVPFATGQASPAEAALHAGTAPAILIIALTAIHMWARRTGVMSSSKYLAMFTMVLAAWLAASGFILREEPAYAWSILVVGALILGAAIWEAFLSPASREGQRPLDPRTQV